MNILILYTHPNHQSFNNCILESVIKGLNTNATVKDIRITDLYAENFNPLLQIDDNHKRRHMHEDPDTEPYRRDILWADHIMLIYPIWWGRPPAMLLGYIDRLMASGFAYKYKQSTDVYPDGLLKGKSVTCISTMKGPTGYPLLFLNNAHIDILYKRKKNVFIDALHTLPKESFYFSL